MDTPFRQMVYDPPMRLLLPFEMPPSHPMPRSPKFRGSCELLQSIHPEFLHSGSLTSTASNQYGSETCLLFIYQLNRLQKVLNAAARVLCLASKFDHIG